MFCSRRRGNDERNGRAQECQVCADEDKEEVCERLQGIMIVIAIACVVRKVPQTRWCTPRPGRLPMLPRPHPPRVWEDKRPRGLPLGRRVIYIQWVGDAGQVFGEHKHDHVFIIDIFICFCTTMGWPSISATASDEEEESERVATCLFALANHQSPNQFRCTIDGLTSGPLRDPATPNVLLVLTVPSRRHAGCGCARSGSASRSRYQCGTRRGASWRKSRSQSVGPRDDDVRPVQRETDPGWCRSLRFIQLELPVNKITVHALRQA